MCHSFIYKTNKHTNERKKCQTSSDLWITTVYILQNSANVLAIEIVITN